jgi:uncharacterized membrane protein (UPF0136 family)
MMNPDYWIAAYSFLLFIGGFIGYFKSGSIVSIVVSTMSAALLLGSLYLKNNFPQAGYSITYGLLILLTAFFSFRFAGSGKFMPAGLFSLLSIAMLAYLFFSKK